MLGEYEHERDNMTRPACWHSTNNHCLPHFHSSIELTFVTSGELRATLGGRPFSAGPGHIVLASSYTMHSFATEVASECIILIVPLDFVPLFASRLAKSTFGTCIYALGDGDGELAHCMSILAGTSTHGRNPIDGSMEVVRGYIYVILGMLVERVGLIDIADDQNRTLVRNVLAYLQNNYLSPMTLETLARRFGYSKSRFSHLFNACFGCSLPEYISSLRCRHAAGLLADSVPIIDAAMSAGFESMRTFYRSFRRCYGRTPSEYLLDLAAQGDMKDPRSRERRAAWNAPILSFADEVTAVGSKN